MVCQSCKERKHELCRGTTWCDCQHRDEAYLVDENGVAVRMPPEMAGAIDRFFADPSSGVRRERPVRKDESGLTQYEVKSAEELTALLQEMEATEGGVYDEPG